MKRLTRKLAVLVPTVLAVASGAAVHAAEPQPLRAAQVAGLLASGHGAPLLVEVWSLDCGYCRENAAHLVAWQRQHPQVRLAMVAMDAIDDNASMLTQALAQMQLPATVAQYANAEPMPERLRAALDPGWRGELPRTLWIGADGVRRAQSGLLAPATLDAWQAGGAR
ncbi:TlpA disulfide reductase family protein [Burkholderia alba]|uniref:TlpA disulfide reductase family protein n=1 Tax=Burkholderia alba TaxID=2683677 RepID=UPI002B0575FA|nr:TlpA disulfide reductase family protein [Burkholderia alba]